MSKKRRIAAFGGIGLAVSALVLAANLVLPGTTSATPATATTYEGRGPGGIGSPDGSTLADALGITVDELSAAQQKAHEAAIAQALSQGLITEAQAEAMRSGSGFRGHGFPMLFGADGANGIDQKALLADALGITVDELNAAEAKAADARLAQAVDEGRITQEEADLVKARQALADYIQEKGLYEAAVQQAVDDGVITQDQADAILKDAGPGMHGFLDAGPGMHGFGGFGPEGIGQPGDMGRQAPPGQSAPNTEVQPGA